MEKSNLENVFFLIKIGFSKVNRNAQTTKFK
jgi:hypothetical protein